MPGLGSAVVDFFKKKPESPSEVVGPEDVPAFDDFESLGQFSDFGAFSDPEDYQYFESGYYPPDPEPPSESVFDLSLPDRSRGFLGRLVPRRFRRESALPSINMLVQVRRVVDGTFEDLSGHRFVVWEVQGRDSTSDNVMAGWIAMLNNMEFPVQVLIRQHAPDYSDVRRQWREARPEHMKDGPINRVANSLLDFTEELETCGLVVSRKWYVSCAADREMEMQSALTQAQLNADRMGDEELSLLFQACVSGMGYGYRQDFYQARAESSYLELNRRYVSFLEVDKWPRQISLDLIEGLLRTGEELDLSLWIFPISQRESHSRLQMQRSRFEGARIAAHQSGKLVSPEVETAIDDATRIAEQVSRGVSRLYRRTIMVGVYSPDRDGLRVSLERVSSHFRSLMASSRLLKFRQGAAFSRMFPLCRAGFTVSDFTDSESMLRLFPFTPHDLDRRAGTLFGMDLRSRTPVMFDPFDDRAMNAHMCIMARSGGGKSFVTKAIVSREAERDIPIYIIDPEGEYGVITESLGGRVFVPGSPGYGLNPFVIGYSDPGDLATRISGLCSLIGVMLEGQVKPALKASIDRCMTAFYEQELERKGPYALLGTGGIADFHKFLLTDEAREMGGVELHHLLSPFATGSAQYLMCGDAPDLMTGEAPVTSFNLKNLAGPLKPVAIAVCAQVVWALAVTNRRPRRLIVDECWTVLATPSGAESLLTIVKRARKHQLGLITITQDVQDFLAEDTSAGVITGHAGLALLQNSATKLALSQDPAALDQVATALALGRDIRGFLSTAIRGQGVFIDQDGGAFPLEVVSTPEERELLLDQSWRFHGESDATLAAEFANMQERSGDEGLSIGAELLAARLAASVEQERRIDEVSAVVN